MGDIAFVEKSFKDAEKLYRIGIATGADSAELRNNLGLALASVHPETLLY
jgi:hypothetical protein